MSDMIQAELEFEQMLDEWRRLDEDDPQVRQWTVRLEAMRREHAALVQSGDWIAGPADLLTIIGRARREVDHCAVLAWLLDPSMPHGLGTRLLRRFLARATPDGKLDEEELRRARCEISREHCRADIVVTAPDLTLVVEAKVDHVERPGQCDDIYRDFGAEHGVHFVFLTPNGRSPDSGSGDAAEAFRCLSFADVLRDVRECVAEVEAKGVKPKGWPTVESYVRTLEVEFS